MFKFRGLFLFRFMVFFILMNKEKKIVNFLEIWEFLGKGWSDGNRDDFLNLDIFFFRGCFFSDFMNSEVNYINVSKVFFKFYGD